HEAREPAAVRILLPVDEMLGWRDFERIARDFSAAVRRRAQSHDLRAERDGPFVFIMCQMMERDEDRHLVSCLKIGGGHVHCRTGTLSTEERRSKAINN